MAQGPARKRPLGSVLAAIQGDLFLGQSRPTKDLGPDERRRVILGRVKWWREQILKPKLGGSSQKCQAGWDLGGTWFFRLPGQDWPPFGEAIRAASDAAKKAYGDEETDNAAIDAYAPY
jgi:hypothetical protein